MTDLLLVSNWNHLLRPGGFAPRIMEVPVPQVPCLVSAREDGPDAVVWVHKIGKTGMVRACPRKDPTLRTSIVREIAAAGVEKNLGNVHPLTVEGVKTAQTYLHDFGFETLEALVAEDVQDTFLPGEIDVYVKEWIPEGHLVLLPQDRSFVGDMGQMSTGHVVAVVHNPIRGIVVAKR